MKKKISVFSLLLSLLLVLAVPVQAKAEDFSADCPLTFDKDSGTISADTGTSVTLSEDSLNLIREGYNVFSYAMKISGKWYIYLYYFDDSYSFSYWTPSDTASSSYCFISNGNDVFTTDILSSVLSESKIYYPGNDSYGSNSSLKSTSLSDKNTSKFAENYSYIYMGLDADEISHVYLDGKLLECEVTQEDALYYVDLKYDPYTFAEWCNDTGLSCVASSNETEELYDFSFNQEDFFYIVRRNRIAGSAYSLYLSQVTKEKDLIYYSTNRALADSTIGVAALYVLSGEYASGSTNICNYVYDSSGGGWLYTDNYGVDLGLTNDYFVDDIGISFSSSMPIVYSSTDIYSDMEQSSVYYVADTVFKDPFVEYPIITPTSTPIPTSAPGSGSSGGRPGSGTRPNTGGQATGGGGLDFIINLFTMIWTKICSVPMAVDGYSISLQQIIVYGALVSIVGGFLMHFIFGRK